ncbi:MAG: hypothetical protein J0H66_01505 [Solirubrobacterales bacterium]|nr:hypothetical protein [Solirubrobacterales bacterium]OJU95460.1 MAG: hypothetical protein BGO23_06375 [Solirubrobacterales bacterium 67-14]
MIIARNILIIALLAAGVAFLPNGGNVASAVMTTVTMGFLAGLAWTVYRLTYQFRTALLSLSESRRVVLYSCFGLVVLLIAGSAKMFSTGLGTLAWLLLMASALVGVWLIVSEARSY